jgi:excisionase family DNA binding protein
MSKNVKIFLDKFYFFVYNAPTYFEEGEVMISSGLMTIEDVADYLKVTRRTIYDWLKHNKIPALKLVGQWRFKKDKIDAWLDNQSQPH